MCNDKTQQPFFLFKLRANNIKNGKVRYSFAVQDPDPALH